MSMLLSLVFMHCVFSSIKDSSNNITCEITVYMLTVFFNSLRSKFGIACAPSSAEIKMSTHGV